MRTKQVVSAHPVAPAAEERNYHPKVENFCAIFCRKNTSVAVGPRGSTEGYGRPEGLRSKPHSSRCCGHKPELPLGKARLSPSTNPQRATSRVTKWALLSHL